MHHLFPLAAMILLVGCTTRSHPRKDTRTIAPTPTEERIVGRPTLGMPISVPGRPVVMVPFAVETEKGLFGDKDPYGSARRSTGTVAISASRDGGGAGVRWHNVIFRDTGAGEDWTALPGRGVSSMYQFLGHVTEAPHRRVTTDAIGFLATTEDTNRNGALDDGDAIVAILTGPGGREPRIVSPPDAQVWSMRYDAELRSVFMLVVGDTNRDGRFDTEDAPIPHVVGVDARERSTPVVSETMLDRVDGMLR